MAGTDKPQNDRKETPKKEAAQHGTLKKGAVPGQGKAPRKPPPPAPKPPSDDNK
jgi:hypothetical protein